ncbi:MAG: hypothetical protein WDM89_12090 [Rhizomicrobium sp.]
MDFGIGKAARLEIFHQDIGDATSADIMNGVDLDNIAKMSWASLWLSGGGTGEGAGAALIKSEATAAETRLCVRTLISLP